MLVFRTDALIQSYVDFVNRDIYLASVLKKNIKIMFYFSDKLDFSNFFRKKGISWCLDKDFSKLKNTELKSIIWDVKRFRETDMKLLEWTKENKVNSIQITDLGLNQQPVNYTIDPSLSRKIPYKNGKMGLFGPEYVILHHKYRHFNRIGRYYQKKIKKIFLAFSKELDYRQLRNVIDFFYRHNYNLKIHTTSDFKKSHKKILKKKYPSIHFVGKVESLARSFFEADIAIVTAGDLAYRAAACGTPCFYICYNTDQEFLADALENRGVGYKLQNLEDLSSPAIINMITSLTYEKRKKMGELGKSLVDAKGIYRIIDFLIKKDII